MSSKSPSYTTQNNFGIYIFQFRFPKQLKSLYPEIQSIFRRSLYTRCKREANSKARIWWLLMDELTRRMLVEPSVYGRAMELLIKYQDHQQDLDWRKLRDFYDSLDEYDQDLVDRAIKYKSKLIDIIGVPSSSIDTSNVRVDDLYQPHDYVKKSDSIRQTDSKISSNDPKISFLLEKFLIHKGTTMTKSSIQNYEPRVNIFTQILTEYFDNKEPRLTDLTPESIRHYRDTLKKLPSQRGKFKSGTTISKMISSNGTSISQKTLKDSCSFIGQFFIWAEDEGYTIQKDLGKIFKSVKNPTKKQISPRDQFTDDDLKKLFESEEYRIGTFKRSSEYWTPLISLFTGARQGEILQLTVSDIREDSNIWVFDINNEDEKNVKTESGKRLVPIHSKLIELGFLDFVNQRKKSSSTLFPEEKRSINGRFSPYSKRFRTYRNKQQVITPENSRLDFHSFRHTVRTKLVDQSISESLIDDIIGHSSVGSTGRKTYTHTQQVPQKKNAIETISYSINFKLIRDWDKTAFYRLLLRR